VSPGFGNGGDEDPVSGHVMEKLGEGEVVERVGVPLEDVERSHDWLVGGVCSE